MRVKAHCARFVLGLLALAIQALAGEQAGDSFRLLPQTPVEREIAPGEVHLYEISAEANRFLRIVIDQPGVDLRVSVREKDGAVVAEVNNPGERQASEIVSLLAETATTYLFELRPLPGTAGPGRYRIRIEELREPVPADRLRIAAERAEAVADRQYLGQTAEGLAQAVESYRTALERWREVGDPRKAGEVVYRLGLVQRLRGEPREALHQLEQALESFRGLGDRAWQAAVLNQRGLVYWQLGETDKAFAAFDEALALRRALGDAESEAKILNNLGLLHHRAGRLRAAREAYLQALEIFRRTGDRKREGILLGNLGNVHEFLGEPLAALRLQEEALALARATGDRGLEAEARNSLGLVYRQLGEPQKALESYHAGLAVFRAAGNRGGEATALNNLGSMYIELGLAEEALGPLRQAIEIHRETGARGGQASALSNLGRSLADLGRSAEALEAFSAALDLHRAAQDRSGEAATLSNLGLGLVSDHRDREALEPLRQALAIRQELGDRYREARVRHVLGRALLNLGETGPALLELETALRLHREVGDPAGEAAALQEIARTELARGNLEPARARLEPALQILESQRLRVTADRLRSAYFASFQEAYELYVDLLMSLHARQPGAGYDARAFEAAEAARARSLLDLLREARVELRRGADAGLLDEERRLRLELSGKTERQARVLERKHTEEEAAEARRELQEALAAYEIAEARLRAGNPAYAGLLRPEAIPLTAVQALLDEDTVLLEYSLGERRSFLWAVTPAGLRSFELPGRAEIEAAAREAHESLRTLDPGEGARRREILSRLGRMLLGPVAESLGGRRLAVVSGGALQLVPFAVLPLPSGEPVLAAHEVVSLPSSAVLGELRRKAPSAAPGAIAVLADPVFRPDDARVASPPGAAESRAASLPADLVRAASGAGLDDFPRLAWTRSEAEAAVRQAGGRPVLLALDFDASLDTVRRPDLSQFRVLHFATHGVIDDRHPELSGLVLSLVDASGRPRDGFLRLPDLYNLDLGADLVVLSGCKTALGREVRGEGLMGLSRGFFYAGASRVLATLWPVRDRATADLMERFYRSHLRDGLPPAEALRAAQLALRQDPRWRDPYFWAPFVLQGDWDQPDRSPTLPGPPERPGRVSNQG